MWVGITAAAVLAVGAVTGAGVGWASFATVEIATAHRAVSTASEALSDVTGSRGMAIDKAGGTISSLQEFLAVPRPGYLDEATFTELSAATDALGTASAHLAYTPFDPPRLSKSADLLPWTVLSDVQRMHAVARQEDDLGRKRAKELTALNAAQKRASAATTAVYDALAARGEQVLTADTSATYASKIDLRHAIDDGDVHTGQASAAGAVFVNIMLAIDGVDASQVAGEAAKQDPAYPVRADIEAYGRSIARGVTIDFEWHHEVSGLGDDWYSGTTMYHEADGGWATIDLNFALADGWRHGDRDAKALVTHEIGHAQVVRPECKPLFEGPVFNADDEMWATAWAIGLGFDTGGSGISAYGRPSDEQIAVASQCR
jgi:hypothetical protein